LEHELNLSGYQDNQPISIDSVLDPSTPDFSTKKPTLFRERHGWCPYSERVWLALELSGASYDTVRIDNTGHGPRPSYYSGQTPQMRWHDGRTQGESMDLVAEVDERYANGKLLTNDSKVQEAIRKFSSVWPSRARPSSRAAFLFQYSGEPIWKSTFEETLEKVNDMLNHEHPFFANHERPTAADICYAPFLERYRYQLPCLHQGLNPADVSKYPNLAAWYEAMDQVPAYICRVKGDASSWRKVLTMAGFGNAGVPSTVMQNMKDREIEEESESKSLIRQTVWDDFHSSTRSYSIPASPYLDAATIIASNRKAIVKDAAKGLGNSYSEEEIDAALQGLVTRLMKQHGGNDEVEYNDYVNELAVYLDNRMCVPRDMGAMSAATIKTIAAKSKR